MSESLKQNQPLLLLILDGWGHRDERDDNGIELANKPYFDKLWQEYPHTLIDGSGKAVGLPEGIMGNSEVGHMNLGAGRIIFTGLSKIYQQIESGKFFLNPAYRQAIDHVKEHGGRLHLMGLVSDGAVHSHQDHLYALLKLAQKKSLDDVVVHCFMDGRDTPPKDGIKYIEELERQIKRYRIGRIGSLSGRYFAMDRDQRWDRVEKAFWAICGRTQNGTFDYKEYVKLSYESDIGDEFIEPVSVMDPEEGKPISTMSKKDAIIFFNFRADRAREITRAFVDKEFKGFDRRNQELPGVFVCNALYDKDIAAPVAFESEYPEMTFPEILAKNKIKQLRIAETEKFAHVTFFFNGGRDVVFDGEDRKLIPSPREVKTYDLKPEMSLYSVKDELLRQIDAKKYGVIICNFANTDMVGHTAVPEAIQKAVECVDDCLSEIVPRVLRLGGAVIITADHGNAEQMVDKEGNPMTAHTTNLVPFILASDHLKNVELKSGGRLCDVAPTMLDLLGIEKPKDMTGKNLIKK